MKTNQLRLREKQLARATAAMRSVAEQIEAMAFAGKLVTDPIDYLMLAAELRSVRASILKDETKHPEPITEVGMANRMLAVIQASN